MPSRCEQSWCYVDAAACKLSTHMMHQSAFFSGRFYSYSTCTSSTAGSVAVLESDFFATDSFSDPTGKMFRGIFSSADYWPVVFKRHPSLGHELNRSGCAPLLNDTRADCPAYDDQVVEATYQDDAAPFLGALPDFLEELRRRGERASGRGR